MNATQRTACLSDAAFAWLQQQELIATTTNAEHLPLLVPETAVLSAISVAYKIPIELLDGLSQFLDACVDEANEIATCEPNEAATFRAERDRRRYEFSRPYVGDDTAVTQLQDFILVRMKQHAPDPASPTGLSISIVQSSGFGKSRSLRELALHTKDDPRSTMKTLYTNVCPDGVALSAYPEATKHIRDHFFPSVRLSRGKSSSVLEQELVETLLQLFDYAVSHWEDVGNEWFSLFNDQANDQANCQCLQDHTVVPQDTLVSWQPRAFRIVVLAIDDARFLLRTSNYDPIGWYQRFCRALSKVSLKIYDTYGGSFGLCAVLVDSDSRVMGVEPPDLDDQPLPGLHCDERKPLFLPFVPTHAMDIRFEELVHDAQCRGLSSLQFYQQLVDHEDRDAWASLVSMGRPLWDRVKLDHWHEREEPAKVIQLAANQLLGGLSAEREESFTEEASLCGVASILCRLGLRPHSWSPLASRLVADYMAVLRYASYTHTDRLLSSYSSDPILTFGAARVWYQSATSGDVHATLARHILPHFRKLLIQGAVDTEGIGGRDLVGCIVLLLVMDATGAVVSSSPEAPDTRYYAGAFHSVETFLHTLYGNDPLLVLNRQRRDVTAAHAKRINSIVHKWHDWRVGFSHFVQLSEWPSQEFLWAMLTRRAAGILPRDCQGVELVIPIFRGSSVSTMLIHVVNRIDGDPAVPDSALWWPSGAVTKNEFRRPDIVRIYMNWGGAANRKPFYLVDAAGPHSTAGASTTKAAYVLCLQGLNGWTAGGRSSAIPVLSDGLALELRELLELGRDRMRLVEEDLDRCCDRNDVHRDGMHPLLTWRNEDQATSELEAAGAASERGFQGRRKHH